MESGSSVGNEAPLRSRGSVCATSPRFGASKSRCTCTTAEARPSPRDQHLFINKIRDRPQQNRTHAEVTIARLAVAGMRRDRSCICANLPTAFRRRPAKSVDLRIITRPEDFAALQPVWDRLYRRCARQTLFLSHGWLDAAWQWRTLSASLFVLCCERDGELVGALPLVRDHEIAGGRPGRTLKFLAVPDTQRCDVLATAGDAAFVANAFADELLRHQADWDVLRLRYLPAGAIGVTMLAAALAERGLRSDIRLAAANPCIALDAPWNAYYASRSRRLKKATNLAAQPPRQGWRSRCPLVGTGDWRSRRSRPRRG